MVAGHGARRGGKAASREEAARPDGSPHTPPLPAGRATDRLRRAQCSGTRPVPQPFLLRRAGRPRLGEEALSEPRPPGPVLRSGGLLSRAGRRGPGSELRRHVLVCMRKRRSRAQLAPGAGDRAPSPRAASPAGPAPPAHPAFSPYPPGLRASSRRRVPGPRPFPFPRPAPPPSRAGHLLRGPARHLHDKGVFTWPGPGRLCLAPGDCAAAPAAPRGSSALCGREPGSVRGDGCRPL